MRSRSSLLLAVLQLTAVTARHHGFSIHEDVNAYPQYEVVFSDSYILEQDAQNLLDGVSGASATPSSQSDVGRPSAAANTGNDAHNDDDDDAPDGGAQVSETYEIMNVPPSRYLCSVPVLAPPAPPNQTATELARAEEAREFSRLEARGKEIINSMEGECMYYMSGWWSYSFCYGKEVVQFHALTTKTGKPVKDPHSQEYVLGRMQPTQHDNTAQGEAAEAAAKNKKKNAIKKDIVDVQKPLGGDSSSSDKTDPYNTELVVKGDQRYMVQRLGLGTLCDLTLRERTIEIQYHCNPGATSDRIAFIKEVTTCSYLMEVRTPRLCEEPGFLPPKPSRAHPISCRRIVGSEEEAARWHEEKTREAYQAMGIPDKAANEADGEAADGGAKEETVVGGISIGARKALGRDVDGLPPLKLNVPKHAGGATPALGNVVLVLVKAASVNQGGEILVVGDEELAALNIHPDVIQELVSRIEKIAGGKPWRLEAVDTPGATALEIRAVLQEENQPEAQWVGAQPGQPTHKFVRREKGKKTEEGNTNDAEKQEGENNAETTTSSTKFTVVEEVTITRPEPSNDKKENKNEDKKDNNNDNDEGSEETFKRDEL